MPRLRLCHTHTHTHTHAYTTHTHTHTCTHARTHARTHANKHTHARTHPRTHAHTHARTHTRKHILPIGLTYICNNYYLFHTLLIIAYNYRANIHVIIMTYFTPSVFIIAYTGSTYMYIIA